MKIVDYCESNKQMGRLYVLRINMKPCKLQGRTASSQGGLDKRRNMSVKDHKVKKCLWVKKSPLKTVALAVDEKAKAIRSSRGRTQS